MTDTYSNLVNTNPVGKKIAGQLGLPRPAQLRRYAEGQDLLGGPAAVAGIGDAPVAAAASGIIKASGADVVEALEHGLRVEGERPSVDGPVAGPADVDGG